MVFYFVIIFLTVTFLKKLVSRKNEPIREIGYMRQWIPEGWRVYIKYKKHLFAKQTQFLAKALQAMLSEKFLYLR